MVRFSGSGKRPKAVRHRAGSLRVSAFGLHTGEPCCRGVIAKVNKRARNRLIGVTAIVVLIIVVVLVTTMQSNGAYSKSVDEVLKDRSLVGKRVRVSGSVVPGSWNKGSNPMLFTIKAENGGAGGVIKVAYNGAAPNTFGDGVVAIVTGTLEPGGVIQSSDMITKCPSKYESATGAMTVANLLADKNLGITFTKVTGYVVPNSLVAPGSGERFKLADKADGTGATVSVAYAGAVPNGMTAGKKIVVSGKPKTDGTFAATQVAVDSAAK
jgi:cytochrome c-type biogenesis protein CcmE